MPRRLHYEAMREPYRVDIHLSVPHAAPRWLLVAALLVLVVPELGSESVTLTTYYPAPSGVYTQMITTGDTYLARDSGKVAIGATSATGKLEVKVSGEGISAFRLLSGANPFLDVMPKLVGGRSQTVLNMANRDVVIQNGTGFVGIGTAMPDKKLHVAGDVRIDNTTATDGVLYPGCYWKDFSYTAPVFCNDQTYERVLAVDYASLINGTSWGTFAPNMTLTTPQFGLQIGDTIGYIRQMTGRMMCCRVHED